MRGEAPLPQQVKHRGLPPEAYLTALLSLPGIGPARLRSLAMLARNMKDESEHTGGVAAEEAVRIWDWLRSSVGAAAVAAYPGLAAAAPSATHFDVAAHWELHQQAEVQVLTSGHRDWPNRLLEDPEPPAVLYARGRRLSAAPSVAIVGTRRCSPYGREVARQLGAALMQAGVQVVSGLAMGIDAAAHRGAVNVLKASVPVEGTDVAPVAVLGAGFDQPVPRSNAELFADICARGTVYSETPLRQSGARWRFPARNRIIAGLSDAVVVVESAHKGGSLYTVEEALLRDRPVLAVPGSIFSGVSAGTNRLLADGAIPCLGVDDVLACLPIQPDAPHSSSVIGGTLARSDQQLLDLLVGQEMALDELVAASGVAIPEVMRSLRHLEGAGWVRVSGAMVIRSR